MAEEYNPTQEPYINEVAGRLKDLEEKQRLLRDRILLIGNNVIDDRESMLQEIQEIKKTLFKTREENIKIQDFLKKVAEQLSGSVRKEELLMLQRQIELFMISGGKK